MPFRPTSDRPPSNLEAIAEDTEPDDGGVGFAARRRLAFGRRALSDSTLNLSSAGITSTVVCSPVLTTQLSPRTTRCVETSTRTVETRDQCVCTEASVTSSTKMAECISKLRTVTDLLQPMPSRASPSESLRGSAEVTSDEVTSVPAIPMAPLCAAEEDGDSEDTASFHDCLESPSSDLPSPSLSPLLSQSRRYTAAPASLATTEAVLNGSHRTGSPQTTQTGSKSSKVVEKLAQTSYMPFISKRLAFAATASSSAPGSRDDVSKRSPLARKKRLLIDQLLGRSASLPEQNDVTTEALLIRKKEHKIE